ncbi:2-oxo acid dehydrogenase subunit E2 [Arthrobacter crusticola]|uniref:Dihydrolipoamide acetyltransferase component of pyruvate dehydrogenase complex n=1 Tax=Arthrobacter crusticola TaxID=2547960 RepID=A0A4R5U061_9MICC|nr:dihydrolipoamide acetyltransferase family protein [Arthrobacter crusticola]TDK26925.1 2-oxo acid dehydrogenase subunit E2 [Arthrobacter crusticola]
MIKEFRLPDLGEGLTESEIVNWHVAVGDTVELNQIIADVETAKAVVELPSPYAGVIAELHEQPGTVVEVGAPLVSFEVAGPAGAPPTTGGAASAGDTGAPAKREPNLVGYGAAVEKGGRPERRARRFASQLLGGANPAGGSALPGLAGIPGSVPMIAAVPAVPARPAVEAAPVAPALESAGPRPAAPGLPTVSGERPRSTPPVRKLARDLGIRLEEVPGTGPGGLITRDDVLAASSAGAGGSIAPAPATSSPATSSPAGVQDTGRETRAPIKGMRKHTAAAMVASAFTAPHVTEFLTVDVTPTMELIGRVKESKAFAGVRITPLTIVAKALCIALRRNPTLNSRWDEAAGDIVQFNYVNLGIAAATPRGLLVPNIKDAQELSLMDLAGELTGLTERARAGKTGPADLSGGTISITNIGVFGIDAGTPILNPGEAAILAMGAVRRMPWEYEGQVALRSVMTLSLSFDHRLVDGEQGSRFLADIGAILADPGMVLAMV